jgi:phosphoserine phosphatase RsbU/P
VLPDVRLDERYVIGREQTLSEITVPIMRNERAIGALNLESDRLGAFDAGDLEVLRFFADAAAFSIEKAMLHLQLLEKEHLEDQLRTARQVQSHLLPDAPPSIPGFELVGVSLPTYEIGGDYYDYIPLDQNHVGIVVADVAGSGVAAALVMSAFRALLRTHAKPETNLAQLAGSINRMLPEFCGRGDFVTAVYAVLDSRTGSLHYVNCGHNPPLLIRACGEAEKLGHRGPALGVFPAGHFESKEVNLAPGNVLVFYTDGVVELTNAEGEFYGESRLAQAACNACQESADGIIQAIIQGTRAFSKSEIYHDDFTLIILQRKQ